MGCRVETAWCVASVVETRWVAAETPQGCQGYHWSFWACSQPRIAARARRVRRARAAIRGVVLCFPHERGAMVLCSAPPLWPSLGVAQCVAAAGGRSLLSDRIER